jgi:hypothetical protein
MTLSPALRKLALTVHLTSSVGWIGAVVAYLALGVAAVTSSDTQTVRAAWAGMELTGWWVIVPLSTAGLLTGLVMSLGTRWGLFRHYWVLISLVLTIICVAVLQLHMPTVSAMASLARNADGADLRALGGDLFHPGVGLVLLLLIAGLNVYKPAGLTPYGWRKQREDRNALQVRTGPPGLASEEARPVVRDTPAGSTWRAVASRTGYFTFHFAEMWFAMFLGMALFMVVTIARTALGTATFSEPASIEFEVAMSLFMVVPMAAWMRIRGCDWRACSEMSAAMLLPAIAAVMLRLLELPAARWVSSNMHALMIVGMLAFMLYKREVFSSGYSLFAGVGRRAAERPSLAAQGSQPAARLESH